MDLNIILLLRDFKLDHILIKIFYVCGCAQLRKSLVLTIQIARFRNVNRECPGRV